MIISLYIKTTTPNEAIRITATSNLTKKILVRVWFKNLRIWSFEMRTLWTPAPLTVCKSFTEPSSIFSICSLNSNTNLDCSSLCWIVLSSLLTTCRFNCTPRSEFNCRCDDDCEIVWLFGFYPLKWTFIRNWKQFLFDLWNQRLS